MSEVTKIKNSNTINKKYIIKKFDKSGIRKKKSKNLFALAKIIPIQMFMAEGEGFSLSLFAHNCEGRQQRELHTQGTIRPVQSTMGAAKYLQTHQKGIC